ncbi:MAG: heavy metal translocating P-type ATPase metal-binding domain-containing protein [Bacteroidetes bacterium]|nr:heavy metal translocating P-type ATPase metal-binding domain-containing protein [Bacteroidota bacterium]
MSTATYSLAGSQAVCYHCGEPCEADSMVYDDKPFCCAGCKTVYELLAGNDLSCYYDLNAKPGTAQKAGRSRVKYDWLDDPQAASRLIQYTDDEIAIASFQIPTIHCSSCIYLLENVYRIQPAIVRSQVDFVHKTLRLTFRKKDISLRQAVELIASLGYEPQLTLRDLETKKTSSTTRSYYLKIGVAFFAFGNIMLLSFPEYLGIDALSETPLRHFFGYLNFLLALPVILYSAREFFQSAYGALRQRSTNMDIPIALGMIVMFLRSSYDIFMLQGAGYMDTLASLTLLMLIGRLFQNKTYATLAFDRDYKSYFPVAITVARDGHEASIPLSGLVIGDEIIVRNEELIPADSILLTGEAMMDYSFVTGESVPVPKKPGDMIYAGGKQTGSTISMTVVKDVSHSYLTQLWNDDAFKEEEEPGTIALADQVSRYFTPAVLLIAIAAGAYWARTDMHRAMNAFTAVLIITCPCALALSAPFTLGNAIRILAKYGIYLKNATVIEKITTIRSIIFDKTGTLTDKSGKHISYSGDELSPDDKMYIASVTYHSSHPLSRRVYQYLSGTPTAVVSGFREEHGQGIEGTAEGHVIRVGSAAFAGCVDAQTGSPQASAVHISIDGVCKGHYEIRNEYRTGLNDLIGILRSRFDLYVLSGDNDREKENLKRIIPADHLLFDQQPADKLRFIKQLQEKHTGKVMMVGDGLNDAGALRQSDVGLVVSDDTNNFSPACDAIIDARRFDGIDHLISYAGDAMHIIKLSYGISLLYNMAGIYIAAQGTMSPLVAAILMPISSITIISFSTLLSWIAAHRRGLV